MESGRIIFVVKNYLWPKYKFIRDPKELNYSESRGSISQFTLKELDIPETKKKEYWEENKELIADALKKKRNDSIQQVKKGMVGKSNIEHGVI